MIDFFKKPYKAWVHITIYLVLFLGFLIASIVAAISYRQTQPIIMEETIPITSEDLLALSNMEITESNIYQYISQEDFSGLVFNHLKDHNFDSYYYDALENLSYFNIVDDEGRTYSFVANTDFKQDDNKVKILFSRFKLGKHKIGLLANIYSKKLNLTKEIEMDLNNNNIVYINRIELDDYNRIVCSYSYNLPLIREKFGGYKDQVDSRKMNIYKKEEPKVEEFTQMLDNLEGYSEEGLIKWVSNFQTDRQLLESCALILKDDGIRQICNDFQALHNNTLQADRLIELSQNELDYALMQYHREFSRLLLNYLYQNKAYSYQGGQLMVNGSPINAETILSEKGKQPQYDVEIISDEEGISAYYHSGNEIIQKLILRKE
ncbi:MAG: hypothetical protein GX366_09035 [Epulopiscium sp.]|nr:hypothetical protein [Candidatus Epulonipiscium sp.]